MEFSGRQHHPKDPAISTFYSELLQALAVLVRLRNAKVADVLERVAVSPSCIQPVALFLAKISSSGGGDT